MNAVLFAFTDELSRPAVLIPALGIAGAVLTFFVGRLMLQSRRRAAAQSSPDQSSATGDRVKLEHTRPTAADELDPFIHGAAGEKRVAHRRTGNPVPINIADAGGKIELATGWVIDRSMGGMRLEVVAALDTGATVSVRPRNCSPMTPWVQVLVSNCKKHGDHWQVGCKFLRTPAWSVLVQFG
jgi:hypothetical protein